MALDFGVENADYIQALVEMRNIKLPDSHWLEVSDLIEQESKNASQSAKRQQVDEELMHRCFSL